MGTEQEIGYLALPPAGTGRGLLVLQEWWGLVPHIRDVSDRFAAAGFVALAPDLFHGEQTTSPDEAQRLFMALNIEQTARDLETAAQFLLDHEAVTGDKIGVVGFCMGGQLALLAATLSDRYGAVIDFYGIHPKVQPNFSRLSAPVLGLFAAEDNFVPPAAVEQLEATVKGAGGSIASHTYPNAGHAFFNDTRPDAYQPEAATDAWQRSIDFLNQHL
ncbi:dienelactone hydrolase family protein [Microcoleus sp. FACHB-1515]|uniref:dienelactone hydrolase family protein n=1 Tax=Cyanophyceae TaxID=3028117 RepID=UPI001685C1F4|nr:dienelactone hydrolase family protein [Microcoleus sp. FACHB-1515]MBD2088461.1 dienelactone hydrolase family protein [Microcoleus sp. FACHB-1515]